MNKMIQSTLFICIGVSVCAGVYLGVAKGSGSIITIETKVYKSDTELQALLAISDLVERERQLNHFFAENMRVRPLQTLEAIELTPSQKDRILLYRFAFDGWYSLDASAVFLWFASERRDKDLVSTLKILLKKSEVLEHSLMFASALTPSSIKEEFLMALFEEWILKNPQEILRWSLKNAEVNKWIFQAFKVMTQQSMATAIRSLSYLVSQNNIVLKTAIQAIIDNYGLGEMNAEALLALEQLTPYLLKEELISALLPLLANDENVTLADIYKLINSLAAGSFRDSLHELVALNWAEKKPQEAAKYAESLTGETRELALNAVVTAWIDQDLEAADEWLKDVKGDIDLAAMTIGRGSARLGNVQISDEWLGHIVDPQIRTEAVLDVIKTYYERSPESGVYHLIYQQNLTKQQKLEILHQMYPNESFAEPVDALNNLGRLENLKNMIHQ